MCVCVCVCVCVYVCVCVCVCMCVHVCMLLTPTLSPVIVADDANIEVTARRIMWGKLLNAGQTCVAPDYVLSTKETQDRLIEACKRVINEFFGQVSN